MACLAICACVSEHSGKRATAAVGLSCLKAGAPCGVQVPGFTVSREYSTQSYAVIRDLPVVDGLKPPGEAPHWAPSSVFVL